MSSWILHQRNLHENGVPSLRDIQDALVKMEDKPSSFIGSREWIGSFEISICLDYFYEVRFYFMLFLILYYNLDLFQNKTEVIRKCTLTNYSYQNDSNVHLYSLGPM